MLDFRNDMLGGVCPHGLYLPRSRNGTQAVPYNNAGMFPPFNLRFWKNKRFLNAPVERMGLSAKP